ncbi:MAG: nucleotidyltransferase [Chloroflexi bacterium]|nr:nucleotidyltransferase [Chloroflexota bacterium]MBT3670189.1 nucleotidyltransferase [Chloroflexota bacterium]MBT4004059.1 nucleotidyltransferase [Chloroflexota bacterium]MBT4306137.1 nucleotidyltransferase [Chloroflexota bacterium]MBT4534517.1 nucleotidyltransferase [Chloroflexota bacterium]
MSENKLNIIIPMAGYGKRLRPHTWSKPKPLVSAAGKAVLGHVLDLVGSFANPEDTEISFIIGYQGDQVRPYMEEHYPKIKTYYFEQKEMKGQSHAIAMAKEHLTGPTLILFVDTIVDSDFSFLKDEEADAVIWVKEVKDPRRFGVVAVNEEGFVQGLIEKPESMDNRLAIVGYYYFAKGEELLAAIDQQIKEELITKGEYFLADAMHLMIKQGLKMRPETVNVWQDAGLPDAVLETNRYLLGTGKDNTKDIVLSSTVEIHPPVYIHPSAQIENATIGPNVSIGPGCIIANSQIKETILEKDVEIKDANLHESIIGERAKISGVSGSMNIGDDATVVK